MTGQLCIDFQEEKRITLEEMFEAYYECRKHKRNTVNALKFEQNYEIELVRLMDELNARTYQIGKSIAFIVDKLVKREIFAAHFRDRIVHHLVIRKLNPLFEKEFIYDSYNCRKGRGTLFGIRRLERFIRSCSDNYREDAYVLKLDIKGFFMAIDRRLLLEKLEKFIRAKYRECDIDLLLWMVKEIILNDCTKGCRIKSFFFQSIQQWNQLIRSREGKEKLYPAECGHIQASTNSYFGFMRQHNTYRLRKRMYGLYSARFDKYFKPANAYTKLKQI